MTAYVPLIPILLGLLASPDLPAPAEVVAESLDVFDEPDAAAFSTGQLRRGDRVVVRERQGRDWVAIEPPPGSFSWIDRADVDERGGGEARVVAPRTAVRAGRVGARMPGAPRLTLDEGAAVRLLDRPALTLGRGESARTWVAIEPPAEELRYLHASGVTFPAPRPRPRPEEAFVGAPAGPPAGRVIQASEPILPIDETLAEVGPPPSEGQLPAGLAATLARVEAAHRSILRRPVDQWQLEPIRRSYRSLLDRETDEVARGALGARLARVERQEALAQSARSFQALLSRSRELDRELAQVRSKVEEAEASRPLPYDAEGLLQASSKQVDGHGVYALIGERGETIAYLDVPPGLEARSLLTRRVAVRGALRYNADLRANLIIVRELDPLGRRP